MCIGDEEYNEGKHNSLGDQASRRATYLLAWVLFCLIYQTYPFDNLTARPHNLEELRALFDECHPGGWLAGVLGGLDDVFHDRISKLQYLIHGITLLSDAGNVPPCKKRGEAPHTARFPVLLERWPQAKRTAKRQ